MDKIKFRQAALGIRHIRSFRIPSISGDIVDKIISDPSSPFSKETYSSTRPIIDSQGDLKGRILLSDTSDHSLVLDIDNVILTIADKTLESSIKIIKERYLSYIANEIFTKYSIFNINRLGFIVEYVIEEASDIPDKLLDIITNGMYKKPAMFSLKFAEKKDDLLSYVNNKYFDYQNNIVQIEKNEKELIFKYDFQILCRPEVERITDLDLNSFISSAQEFVNTRFLDIFKKYGS